jgi:hypothetical protein
MMARRPEDPRVADLKRYRKARELEQRRKAAAQRPSERFLGSRPRAGLILAAVVILLVVMWLLPALR